MTARSTVYARAAEMIITSDGWGGPPTPTKADACCNAIAKAAAEFGLQWESEEMLEEFAKWFDDSDRGCDGGYWWADPDITDEDQEARRLALLFMAEIAADALEEAYRSMRIRAGLAYRTMRRNLY